MSSPENCESQQIDEGEFNLLLMNLFNMLANDLEQVKNVAEQVEGYRRSGYRIEFYQDEEGRPYFKPIKKGSVSAAFSKH